MTSEDEVVGEVAAAPTAVMPAPVATRTRAPINRVNEMLEDVLPLLNDVASDSGDIVTSMQTIALREVQSPQSSLILQKGRATRRMAIELQDAFVKLQEALVQEARLQAAMRARAQSTDAVGVVES
jgi:hypothetical protein